MIFEFNDDKILFGMYQGFKKATEHGCAWKLRLTPPSGRCVCASESDFDSLPNDSKLPSAVPKGKSISAKGTFTKHVDWIWGNFDPFS